MATTTGTTTETRPGCPDWCRGHRAAESDWLSHNSRNERAGNTVTVSLTFSANYHPQPVVMVMRHDAYEAVWVTQDDAEKWATILDGAGATDLATAIRDTLARIGGAS